MLTWAGEWGLLRGDFRGDGTTFWGEAAGFSGEAAAFRGDFRGELRLYKPKHNISNIHISKNLQVYD